jgi:hypothetical protein
VKEGDKRGLYDYHKIYIRQQREIEGEREKNYFMISRGTLSNRHQKICTG